MPVFDANPDANPDASLHCIELDDENDTLALAEVLGATIDQTDKLLFVIYLEGTLGAGKTTFSRGVLKHFGHEGAVKSPTYTLVEDYHLHRATLYHFDLYRLGDPEELEFMGVRDFFVEPDATQNAHKVICLVEWPERGTPLLPKPDLTVALSLPQAAEKTGRVASIEAEDQSLLDALSDRIRSKEIKQEDRRP